jgi:hypothetical protein
MLRCSVVGEWTGGAVGAGTVRTSQHDIAPFGKSKREARAADIRTMSPTSSWVWVSGTFSRSGLEGTSKEDGTLEAL